MRARTIVEVGLDSRGRSVVRTVRCEAPLLVRQDSVGATVGDGVALLLVGGAAGPLGGDEFEFVLRLDDGVVASVRSVGATLLQPGPHGTRSTLLTHVAVGDGARLDWNTQPLISVAGSDHRSVTRLEVAAGASVRFAEGLLLGRHQQDAGRVALRQRVEVAGGVVLDHEVVMGHGGPAGPGAHGDVRWMHSAVTIGEDAATTPSSTVEGDRLAGVFPLAAGASLAITAGHDPAMFLV